MRYDEKLYLKVKSEAEPWLFQIPHVYGVALGPKITADKPTGEIAIQVYVRGKRPLHELSPEETIPREIMGVKTDVIEGGMLIRSAGASEPEQNDSPTGIITGATNAKPVVITCESAHGLSTGDLVRIVGVDGVSSIAIPVEVADESDEKTFTLPTEDRNHPIFAPVAKGAWFKVCARNQLSCCAGGRITGASRTNPVEIFTDRPHGLENGDSVRIETITGMTQIKNREFSIETKKDADTIFRLRGENGSGHTESVNENGRWAKVCSPPTGPIESASGPKPVKITSPNHGLSKGDQVHILGVSGMGTINSLLKARPWIVGNVDRDTFELQDVDGATAAGSGGTWIRIREDRRRYTRIRGGIRIAMSSEEYVSTSRDFLFSLPKTFQSDLDKGGNPTAALRDRFGAFGYPLSDNATVEVNQPGNWWVVRDFGQNRDYTLTWVNIEIGVYGRKQDARLVTTDRRDGIKVRKTENLTYGTLGCVAIEQGSGRKVILSNYHVLYSVPGNENVFHPAHKSSKTHKIAELLRKADQGTPSAPSTVDAAIAKLDDDVKADPKIVDIGWVMGTAEITLADISGAASLNQDQPCREDNVVTRRGYRVRKRGVTTLLTEGVVTSIYGNFKDDETKVYLKDQIVISPMAGNARGAFCAKGDSGSVVVNDKNEVVGLLLGASYEGCGFASPIKEVERKLNIKIYTKQNSKGSGGGGGQTAENESGEPLRVIVPIPELITQVAQELLQTEAGAEYVMLVQQHYSEVETLIHHHKRVMATWRRNQGPAIIDEMHHFVEERDIPLPARINGQPLTACLENIMSALKQFGSSGLVSDLTRYWPTISQLGAKSYSDILKGLTVRPSA